MIVIEHPERQIPERRIFDSSNNEFIVIPAVTLKPMKLQLEHSLISIRNWEAEHMKAFSDMTELSQEELLSYIHCMTINTQKDESVYEQLTTEDILKIVQYITRINSAWEIRKPKKNGRAKNNRPNTVEAIYYAMIQFGIPFDPCEKWHLGSLMALIDYCSRNGAGAPKEKPMNMRELRESWYRINEANKKKYHSRG